jgi:hypothetical protein
MISFTAGLGGNSLRKSLTLLILVKSGFQPILYPVHEVVLLMGFYPRERADPKIWLMSLTNKVAIVMDLRAQSTRRFQFSVSKRLVTGSPSRNLIETNFLVLLAK